MVIPSLGLIIYLSPFTHGSIGLYNFLTLCQQLCCIYVSFHHFAGFAEDSSGNIRRFTHHVFRLPDNMSSLDMRTRSDTPLAFHQCVPGQYTLARDSLFLDAGLENLFYSVWTRR
ncbi:hypothetical protein GDO81_004650 [Engystomops pustulosus]|uniref:Uncharacterized protein n=1 Tax=Engystomops pustulosus TaxID=76066 RepID=A0AAV7CIM4_ENGPU|nr:hypothetical protein GDO81_004650 [Engystomops pustulosus]